MFDVVVCSRRYSGAVSNWRSRPGRVSFIAGPRGFLRFCVRIFMAKSSRWFAQGQLISTFIMVIKCFVNSAMMHLQYRLYLKNLFCIFYKRENLL
jgi:hypothetical protein